MAFDDFQTPLPPSPLEFPTIFLVGGSVYIFFGTAQYYDYLPSSNMETTTPLPLMPFLQTGKTLISTPTGPPVWPSLSYKAIKWTFKSVYHLPIKRSMWFQSCFRGAHTDRFQFSTPFSDVRT